jgi:hypothetical protein
LLCPGNGTCVSLPNGAAQRDDLFQPLILFFRFNQNRNVSVGVFPQREEILVCFAALIYVARERGGARKSEMRERV